MQQPALPMRQSLLKSPRRKRLPGSRPASRRHRLRCSQSEEGQCSSALPIRARRPTRCLGWHGFERSRARTPCRLQDRAPATTWVPSTRRPPARIERDRRRRSGLRSVWVGLACRVLLAPAAQRMAAELRPAAPPRPVGHPELTPEGHQITVGTRCWPSAAAPCWAARLHKDSATRPGRGTP